jgi:hypothetical protein
MALVDKATTFSYDVCMPRHALSPSIVTNNTSGTRPAGGGLLRLSVTASTTMSRIAVPKNSWKKLCTFREGCWLLKDEHNTKRLSPLER